MDLRGPYEAPLHEAPARAWVSRPDDRAGSTDTDVALAQQSLQFAVPRNIYRHECGSFKEKLTGLLL